MFPVNFLNSWQKFISITRWLMINNEISLLLFFIEIDFLCVNSVHTSNVAYCSKINNQQHLPDMNRNQYFMIYSLCGWSTSNTHFSFWYFVFFFDKLQTTYLALNRMLALKRGNTHQSMLDYKIGFRINGYWCAWNMCVVCLCIKCHFSDKIKKRMPTTQKWNQKNENEFHLKGNRIGSQKARLV